jgi:magnesium-transporting ATPase (P-type)
MVFTSGIITGGVGWFLSIPIGMVLGVIIFLAQRKWYGDDNEEAFIKALIVAFLTAIPTSLPGYLTIPSGIVGLFHRKD